MSIEAAKQIVSYHPSAGIPTILSTRSDFYLRLLSTRLYCAFFTIRFHSIHVYVDSLCRHYNTSVPSQNSAGFVASGFDAILSSIPLFHHGRRSSRTTCTTNQCSAEFSGRYTLPELRSAQKTFRSCKHFAYQQSVLPGDTRNADTPEPRVQKKSFNFRWFNRELDILYYGSGREADNGIESRTGPRIPNFQDKLEVVRVAVPGTYFFNIKYRKGPHPVSLRLCNLKEIILISDHLMVGIHGNHVRHELKNRQFPKEHYVEQFRTLVQGQWKQGFDEAWETMRYVGICRCNERAGRAVGR